MVETRPALDVDLLRERVLGASSRGGSSRGGSSLWRSVDVVAAVPSSNVALADRARAGAPAGCVLLAEEQTAGRGRHDRGWSAPPRSSVMTSVLLRPNAPAPRWGWVPLLTAVAVVEAVASFDVAGSVKWPNDVLVGELKLAGVLCEVVPTSDGAALVAGWGVNVDQSEAELPGSSATSVRLCGGRVDRPGLAVAVLERFEHWYRRWEADDPTLAGRYREVSSTLGRRVRLHLPGGELVEAEAVGVAPGGGLVVRSGGSERVVAAGDVVHLRGLPRWGNGLPGQAPDRG